MHDVTKGRADFSIILAYDVSRWGRFQDADQRANYEFRLPASRRVGSLLRRTVRENGTIGSNIIKTVKRAMAGEYSRELSAKVFTGQCRLIPMASARAVRLALACAGSWSMSMETQRLSSLAGKQKAWETHRVIPAARSRPMRSRLGAQDPHRIFILARTCEEL